MLKIDVDRQKKCSWKGLRARIIISLNEPLPRGISVFSSRRQRKEWYDVVYERVPFFCFSCGIIGHSEIDCPTPATRDKNGNLPYSEKLRAPEDRRTKSQGEWYVQGNSARRSNSSGACGSLDSNKSVTKKSNDNDRDVSKIDGEDEGAEVSSPIENEVPDFASGSYDDTMVDDFSIDDKLIPSNTKKGKSDMSLMKNRPKEKYFSPVP